MKILVCGGGNGAHCFTGVASSRKDIKVNVLSLYENEADIWTKALSTDKLKVSKPQKDGSTVDLCSAPTMVTNDPEKAIEGVRIIFIVVPAYVHELFLKTLLPYIKPDTLIVGLPGHAGFELQCKYILQNKAKYCSIMGFESLPWACRIVEYGRHVKLVGYKDVLGATLINGVTCNLLFNAVETVQNILGDKPKIELVDNALALTLMSGSMIHPPILYGKWHDWDGMPLAEKPLFYQGVDEEQASITQRVSNELVATAKRLNELRSDLDMSAVIDISDWFKSHYRNDIADDSSLINQLKTNRAYNGLIHPMKLTEKGFVPDFQYRYTSEDVPFGLVIMKGVAEIVNIATPTIDKIIIWAQEKLEKEYVVGNRLVGRDLKEVRAPQSYGLHTLEQLIEFLNRNTKQEF